MCLQPAPAGGTAPPCGVQAPAPTCDGVPGQPLGALPNASCGLGIPVIHIPTGPELALPEVPSAFSLLCFKTPK